MHELRLAGIESFYIGGDRVAFEGPSGAREEGVAGAMYVQRLQPAEPSLSLPVVMVHGGCHTGVTWETTPDGREGWATLFARAGIDTYVVDQPWRGRSPHDIGSNDHGTSISRPWKTSLSALDLFNRGGNRFPTQATHAYASQLCPDYGVWDAVARGHPGLSDPRALAPLELLLERLGRSVLITHSQGGDLGWKAAIAKPANVAAIVAIEPGVTSPGLDDPNFPAIPVCVVWGDNLPEQAFALTREDLRTGRLIADRNPLVTIDYLPDTGIRGNGHMMMMEDNNVELADRAIAWIRGALGEE